jgi:hypothetical protein
MSDSPTFGDNVRVRPSPETEARGVAALLGQVYGETMPSVTGVAVIGEITRDHALNVHFEGRTETLWFAPELLEFVDHAAGAEIRLDGAPKKWVRSCYGQLNRYTPAEVMLCEKRMCTLLILLLPLQEDVAPLFAWSPAFAPCLLFSQAVGVAKRWPLFRSFCLPNPALHRMAARRSALATRKPSAGLHR